MRLIIFGPPGAGKGTQAAFIWQEFSIPHISTGDIFRENIRRSTSLGIEAKKYIDAGDLVPDSVTNAMIHDRLEMDDCIKGFLLDGYPRTPDQADALDVMLAEMHSALDAVVNLIVPDEEIITRLAKRGRSDDSVNTIRHRLHIYHKTTQPLAEYYRERDLLIDVVGVGQIEGIRSAIVNGVRSKAAAAVR
jgi:adenylate kinase